jgi:hypothetical protein
MTALYRIWNAIKALTAVAAGSAAVQVGETAKRYTVRAAAVAALAIAFYAVFNATFDFLQDKIDGALVSLSQSTSGIGTTLALFACMLPQSAAAAFSTLFSIVLLAVGLKWTRMLMFAKLA